MKLLVLFVSVILLPLAASATSALDLGSTQKATSEAPNEESKMVTLTPAQDKEFQIWLVADNPDAMKLLYPAIEPEVLPADQRSVITIWQRRSMGYFITHRKHFEKQILKAITRGILKELKADPENASFEDHLLEKKAAAMAQIELDRRGRAVAEFNTDLFGLFKIAVQRRPELFVTEQERTELVASMRPDDERFERLTIWVATKHHPGEPLPRPEWLEEAKSAYEAGRLVVKTD